MKVGLRIGGGVKAAPFPSPHVEGADLWQSLA